MPVAQRHGGDREAEGQLRRHVLHRVNGEVDLARRERLLDLLEEKSLATDLGERNVGQSVPRGADHDGLDHDAERLDAAGDHPALRERESAAARPEPQPRRARPGRAPVIHRSRPLGAGAA